MGLLLIRLLIALNDKEANSTDYFIAYTMLMNYDELSKMSINEVATLCYVSKSTISKFIRSINFEDYAEFREASKFKENRYGFNLNFNKNIMEFIENKGTDKYIDVIHEDIEELKRNLNLEKIKKLAQYLNEYKKVAAFGALFSEYAALDLQAKLAYNRKFIFTNLDDVKQDNFIKNSKEDTLIILYSNSGRYFEKYQTSEFQTNKDFSNVKAKIILITSNKKFENHPKVDLCIYFSHTSKIQTHSILYTIINDIITMEYRKFLKI